MKHHLLSVGAILSLAVGLFAHESNSKQPMDAYDQQQQQMTQSIDWREQAIDQEKNVEFGAEWLYLTSNLSPIISKEQIRVGAFTTDNTLIRLEDHERKSIDPHYNSGFTAFLRLRPTTKNDMTLKYHYLLNNGDGHLNRNDSYQGISDQGDNIIETTRQQDKGHLHSHMHIGDFMVGRLLPLVKHMSLRLGGGLTFNDFHMTFERTDNDAIRLQNLDANIDDETVSQEFYREKRRFWGVGPKGEFDFLFAMLPQEWEHSLNFVFWGQFSLLYTKEWAHGRYFDSETTFEDGDFNSYQLRDFPWKWGSNYHLTPNINLDIGLHYHLETSSGYCLSIGGGYRLYTYWNLEEIFHPLTEFSTDDRRAVDDYNRNHDKLIYAGPYVKLSFSF